MHNGAYLAEAAQHNARARNAALDLLGDEVHDEVAREVNALGVPSAADKGLDVVLQRSSSVSLHSP